MTAADRAMAVVPGSPEWLEERRKGIGASDVATILGLNPYKTPRQLWAEKQGLLPDEQSEPAEIGLLMEPVIAELYVRRTGRSLTTPPAMYVHPQHAWLRATPDRFAEDRVVELKNAGYWVGQHEFGREGTDEVPEPYLAQVQIQLAVTGYDVGELAVLIGGNRFGLYPIPADVELQERIIEVLGQWYETYLVGGDQPPVKPQDATLLQKLWPQDDGRVIVAPPEMHELLGDLHDTLRIEKQMEYRAEELKTQVKDFLGEASALWISDDERITWKAPKPSRKTNWQAVAEGTAQRLVTIRSQRGDATKQIIAEEKAHLDELVRACTEEKPNSRRFLVPASWRKDPSL